MAETFEESRQKAFLLGVIGGGLDVYCHMTFHSLVATQTGNMVLLAVDLAQSNMSQAGMKALSILTFACGFLAGAMLKRKGLSNWRVITLLPLLVTIALLPLVPQTFQVAQLSLLAFSSGLFMLTFTGSKIEGSPYTIMMSSGNFRQMLLSWFDYLTISENQPELKRKMANNTLVVLSFLFGALGSALLFGLIQGYAIWFTGLLITFLIYKLK